VGQHIQQQLTRFILITQFKLGFGLVLRFEPVID